MVDLLDLQAAALAAPQGQGDQDAVVDGRTRPAARIQVLEVLERRQKGSRGNQMKAAAHLLPLLLRFLLYGGSGPEDAGSWRPPPQRDGKVSHVLNLFI